MTAKKESTLVPEMEVEGLGLVKPGMKVKQQILGRGVIEELALWADGTQAIRVKVPVRFKMARSRTCKAEAVMVVSVPNEGLVPTRKSEALLLAAQPRRWAS